MPRTQKFAATLRAAMRVNGFSKSELARRVWGTTKDTRGYDVARNRDRIGHYLNGTSYPEPDNLVKLAEALGVAPEQLKLDAARRVGTDRKSVPTERPHMEKTWEVRSMDKADTDEAVSAARRAKQTTAEWLTDAIREKIVRERIEVGEVIPPNGAERSTPVVTHDDFPSSVELMNNLEAYERVMRLRGKPISPRGRVLIAAERLLRARLMASVPTIAAPVGTHRPDK
jgi:transcriptional regulator with XRE-family HTH domain